MVRRCNALSVIEMNSIPLADADDSEGLPICRAQREWLVSRYKLEPMIALKFFSDELPLSEGDANTDAKAIERVRRCPKCRNWLHSIVSEDVLRRQSRLSRYCCAGMFVACEEPDARNKNRVTFELFRGEDPCWMIDGVRSFISFCPWCGKKLPHKPFIPES
jgi:hypothetical protein